MPWWKVALPVVIAGSGITAAVVATVRSDDTTSPVGIVWFDSPDDLATVRSGAVLVQAHTNVPVERMTLTVDGAEVAVDEQLDAVDTLRYAEFTWDATAAGSHELQVTATGAVSDVRVVLVDDSAAVDTTTTVPSTSTSSTSSTSTTSTTSTTTAPPATVAPTTPPTTARPVTTPPTTIPKPAIGAVTPVFDGGGCSLAVQVVLSGASDATVTLRNANGDVVRAVDLVVAPFTANFESTSFVVSNSVVTPSSLIVSATGPGGVATRTVPFTIPTCKL